MSDQKPVQPGTKRGGTNSLVGNLQNQRAAEAAAARAKAMVQQQYPLFAVRSREPGVVYTVVGWENPFGAMKPLLVALDRVAEGMVYGVDVGPVTYYASFAAAQTAAGYPS